MKPKPLNELLNNSGAIDMFCWRFLIGQYDDEVIKLLAHMGYENNPKYTIIASIL